MGGYPPNGWFIVENIVKWMIRGYPYFRKPLYNSWIQMDLTGGCMGLANDLPNGGVFPKSLPAMIFTRQ